MADFTKLIPELKDWNNGKGIDVGSWISCVGDFQKAIGYSVVFWPEFVELEGCVVLSSVPLEDVKECVKQFEGNLKTVEATANHLHLSYLHNTGYENVSPEQLKYLGNILKQIYECKLKRDFPDKIFVVEFNDSPQNPDNIDGYILTFYQERKLNTPV